MALENQTDAHPAGDSPFPEIALYFSIQWEYKALNV